MAGTTSGIQEEATAWSGSSAVGGMHLSILSTTPHTYTQGSIYLGCQMVYSVLCFCVCPNLNIHQGLPVRSHSGGLLRYGQSDHQEPAAHRAVRLHAPQLARLCRRPRGRRARVLLLPRGRRRVHELRQGGVQQGGPGVQERRGGVAQVCQQVIRYRFTLVNCPTRQSLLLFIGSTHRKYRTACAIVLASLLLSSYEVSSCKHTRSLSRWTTFLKARLNCSLPGDYPFYFNNIQSTSGWHREAGKRVFYAVFTTPDNAIPGSAICRFVLHFSPWRRLLKSCVLGFLWMICRRVLRGTSSSKQQ